MKSSQARGSTFPESTRSVSLPGSLKGFLPIAFLSLKRQAVETLREFLPLSIRHGVYTHLGKDVARHYLGRFKRNGNDLFKIIHIETLSFCNGGCTFCAAASQFKLMDGTKMPVEVYEKILSDLSQLDYQGRLSLYCNNEPLLDKRLVDFVGMARNACPAAYIEIKTNGKLLTVPSAEALFENGLDTLVVNDYNRKWEHSRPVQRFRHQFDFSKGRVEIEWRNEVERLSNRAGTNPSANPLGKSIQSACVRPFEMITVNPRGDTALCSNDVFFQHVTGNVMKQSLQEIWHGEEYRRVRRAMIEGDRTCTSICQVCDFKGYRKSQVGGALRKRLVWI
jgi:radical SAM protein with 4Fe4S-binding SPASM domain